MYSTVASNTLSAAWAKVRWHLRQCLPAGPSDLLPGRLPICYVCSGLWDALYCKFTAVLQGGQKEAQYCGHVAYSAQQSASLDISLGIGFIRAAQQINIAVTRAKSLHITLYDLSTLTDNTKFFNWFEQQDTET